MLFALSSSSLAIPNEVARYFCEGFVEAAVFDPPEYRVLDAAARGIEAMSVSE